MKRTCIVLFAMLSVIVFTGCPGHEPTYVNLGTIPEQYLPTVPYQDGDRFYMQHESNRNIIGYQVTRYRVQNQGYNVYGFDYYEAKFQPAPSVYFEYELDITTCKPDYPLFDIDIRFSNSYLADSVYYHQPIGHKYAQLTSDSFYASIPLKGEPTDLFVVHDSMLVNGHTYYDVFEFANEGQDLTGIYVKTLFYNYENGVVEIDMSNGEKYLRYEEE